MRKDKFDALFCDFSKRNIVNMNSPKFQREIITKMLAKIAHKPIESYVINRIWHRLNDIRVRFVLQQYVRRKDGYAFADLYLPQIGMIIEINEKYHATKEQTRKDAIRNHEIADTLNAKVKIVYAYDKNDRSEDPIQLSIEEINEQVDNLVEEIRQRIANEGDKFLPCDYSITRSTPEYYKSRGFFHVKSEDWLTTIDDIASVFGTQPKHRGFLRVSGVKVPNKADDHVWWPQSNHRVWHNEISKDGRFIYEFNKRSDEERAAHIARHINSSEKRITFMKELAYGVLPTYKFVGVFAINPELSREKNMCVWERISESYELNL